MEKFLDHFSGVAAVIGLATSFMFGDGDLGSLYVLIAVMLLDYLTGVMYAIVTKAVDTDISFRGIFKKVCTLVIVSVAHLIDTQVFGSGDTIMRATTYFYIANEGLSILKNSTNLGLKVPSKLKEVLERMYSKEEAPVVDLLQELKVEPSKTVIETEKEDK